jgi:hypothetical protein
VIPSDIKHHHAYPTNFELPRLVQSLTPSLPLSLPPSLLLSYTQVKKGLAAPIAVKKGRGSNKE